MKLKQPAMLELDESDVCKIMTDAICQYSALGDLVVIGVSREDGGQFMLEMAPKPDAEEGE